MTVVEPGFFRTDILDPALSLLETSTRISDYDETAGAMRAAVPDYNHQQPGDPAKLAQALLKLVDADDPPLRLPLGSDTLARIAEKNARVERETAVWKSVAESTDY